MCIPKEKIGNRRFPLNNIYYYSKHAIQYYNIKVYYVCRMLYKWYNRYYIKKKNINVMNFY